MMFAFTLFRRVVSPFENNFGRHRPYNEIEDLWLWRIGRLEA